MTNRFAREDPCLSAEVMWIILKLCKYVFWTVKYGLQ